MSKRTHEDTTLPTGEQETMTVLGTNRFGRQHLTFSTDHPKPTPSSPTDVLIKVEYSDLNPVDHHKLNSKPAGTATPDHRTPFIVGFGGSGTVISVSSSAADDESRALLNKRVVFIADPSKDGSYAQYVLCDRRIVTPIPDEIISSHEAACIPIAGCTALESLVRVGLPITAADVPGINAGESKRLLIVGGAGGVGSWATQLARSNYPRLDIVCTSGSAESSAWCQMMGASCTIGHGDILKLGGGPRGSCDHVICLTEPTPELFATLAEVLRPYGKICLVVAGDGIKKLDMSFVFFKCGTVATETVFSSIRHDYHLDQAGEMATILELMNQGRVKAPLSEDWEESKSDWKEAVKDGGYIDIVGGGHMKGKLVMTIGK